MRIPTDKLDEDVESLNVDATSAGVTEADTAAESMTAGANILNGEGATAEVPQQQDTVVQDDDEAQVDEIHEASGSEAASSTLYQQKMIGQHVRTDFGLGKVVNFRESDQMFIVILDKAKEGNIASPASATSTSTASAPAQLSNASSPTMLYTPVVHPLSVKEQLAVAKISAMDLNVAYQSLEKMRKLNLELECSEAGVYQVDHSSCAVCLLTQTTTSNYFPRLQKFVDESKKEETTRFPRLQKLWASTPRAAAASTAKEPAVVLPRIQKLMNDRKKSNTEPCLICASPCCQAHSSSIFRKEGITLCNTCEKFFELEFIIDCVSTPDAAERAKHIDHMVDLYDRSLLLLKYSSQYIEVIARGLETRKEKQNRIGLGSSSVGIVSGVLGVAAAATILTPAGPPLLIASLFFGGGATAVQTGNDAMNYFSEPRKLADRIIALHGMVRSILRITSTLRDAMLRDHIRTDAYAAADGEIQQISAEDMQKAIEKNKAGVLAGANFGRSMTLGGVAASGGAVTTAEAGVIGARTSTAFSRAGTAAARTVRFARFAGGALSAAVLVMEANAIHSTVRSIQAGNPCDKADTIREIMQELEEGQLPQTGDLDDECQAYLAALAGRSHPAFEEPTSCTASATAVPVARAIDIATSPSRQPVEPTIIIPAATVYNANDAAADLVLVVDEDDIDAADDAADIEATAVLQVVGGGQQPRQGHEHDDGISVVSVENSTTATSATAATQQDLSASTSLLDRIRLHQTRRLESNEGAGVVEVQDGPQVGRAQLDLIS